MNIRRQYSLPNCTLILEGFDDGTGKLVQTLAVLSNVECHFVASKQVLNGGKVFFDHLVRSVSEYTQGLLSGLHHPAEVVNPEGQVQIETLPTNNTHRLVWTKTGSETGENHEVHLTTAELFDLTEAIDQFLADGLTLPNFVLPLTPLSRRHCIPEQSFAERAVPPVIGISGFALTAFALFFVPVPEATRTANDPAKESETTEQTTKVSPEAEASSEELENLVNTVPEIRDDLSLKMMQTYLYRTLDEAWQKRPAGQTASYRISLTPDGSIVGYQPLDGTPPEALEQTPLPQLSYTPVDQAIATSEAVGQFKVVFNGTALEVSPWKGFRGDVSFDSSEVRGEELRQLVLNVRQEIIKELGTNKLETDQALKYSIGVTDGGAIAFYQSDDAVSETAVEKTPLPGLIQPEAAGIIEGESVVPTKPLTQVKVVFKPNGVVEVSPWAGYR